MDLQKQMAMAAAISYAKRHGLPPPVAESAAPKPAPIKKNPDVANGDRAALSKSKNAAAAALAAKMGGGFPRGPPPSQGSAPPPAASAGRGGALSADDEAIAAQYRKMMKLGLPEGAVRHKMTADGVPSHIVESVLTGGAPGGSSDSSSARSAPPSRPASRGAGPLSNLSPEDEKIAAQYRKLVKLGLPEGAVRHKMTADGISEAIQNSVMAGEMPASEAGTSAAPASRQSGKVSSLSPSDEAIAAPYRKMVKLGLPEGAVRHKMTADGVSDKIQNSVLAGEISAGGAGTSAAPAQKQLGNVSSLSPSEEALATPYRKMVKLGLPEGAVRHKMTADGIAPNIQDSVLKGEIPAPDAGGASAPSVSNQKLSGKISSLSPSEEAIATPYRKMAKMGLPEGAIRHKMTADGIAANIQDSVIAGEIPAPNAGGEAPPAPMGGHPLASASMFAAAANSLKKATINTPAQDSLPKPPTNPMAAMAEAAALASKRRSERVGQNPLTEVPKRAPAPPQPSGDPMSAMAAAAVAASKRRSERVNQNPQLVQPKPSPVPTQQLNLPKLRPTRSSSPSQPPSQAVQQPNLRAPSPSPKAAPAQAQPMPLPKLRPTSPPSQPAAQPPNMRAPPPSPRSASVPTQPQKLPNKPTTPPHSSSQPPSQAAQPPDMRASMSTQPLQLPNKPTTPPPSSSQPLSQAAHPPNMQANSPNAAEPPLVSENVALDYEVNPVAVPLPEPAKKTPILLDLTNKKPEKTSIPAKNTPVLLENQSPSTVSSPPETPAPVEEKKESQTVVSKPAAKSTSNKKRKRKERKSSGGARVRDDGAESHCACTIM